MTLKNNFFELINNSDFEKPMKNIRKHRDIKLITTKKEEVSFRT